MEILSRLCINSKIINLKKERWAQIIDMAVIQILEIQCSHTEFSEIDFDCIKINDSIH